MCTGILWISTLIQQHMERSLQTCKKQSLSIGGPWALIKPKPDRFLNAKGTPRTGTTLLMKFRCFIISRLQIKCHNTVQGNLVMALSNDATNQFTVPSDIDQDLTSTYWSVIFRLLKAAPKHMNISLLIHRVWGVFMRIRATSHRTCWSGLSWPHFTPCLLYMGVILEILYVKKYIETFIWLTARCEQLNKNKIQ